MDEKNFVDSYLSDLSSLIKPQKDLVEKLIDIKTKIQNVQSEGKKLLVFGNGGRFLSRISFMALFLSYG